MEGNLSRAMIPGGSPFGGLDLQGSMMVHHHAQNPHNIHHHHHHPNPRRGTSAHPGFPLTAGTMQNSDQPISMIDYNKMEIGKCSVSDEDEPSFAEEGVDGHNDGNKGKKGSPWQRVKWTDKMVRLLITAVSYIGEDMAGDCGGGMRRKFAVLQKKGKWKSVSKVIAERGYHVSPQQCEDKFNDLNKRYKKLNDMLGRGTSCQVVENPALLDVIDYLTEKEKDDVRKILSSKHLFYEEMCSYHNGNRLHLPHDLKLQRSLQLALRRRDENESDDVRRHQHDDLDDDDHDMETDDHDELEENHASHGDNRAIFGAPGGSTKRSRQGQVHEDACFQKFLNSQDCNKSSFSCPPVAQADKNQVLPDYSRAAWLQKQWIESRSLQLEEQKLQIQVEMLELEKQRFKWQRFSKKSDCELEKIRMENERMKLENERMALELKRKELAAD
ncbi:Sequence-specific DNA binding transcription factor [Gossypium australe]|uniref:Sequence-specific DNA binding transcription factor n=1 Tax=Gossypium australe TaxID=47621 RepID=A0A5B6V7V4_9ROSI|nr:Sequence-specific DNA binding transcription factor [Gossypium australe]